MPVSRRFILTLLFVCLLPLAVSQAQGDLLHHRWEVYLERDVAEDGVDRLVFLDILSGATTTADIAGERYTPLDDSILFFDPRAQQVMQALPTGRVEPHPFITLADGARRVDWLVADDARWLVWTLTYAEGQALRTVTWLATHAGTEPTLILEDGPRSDGVRALPVAFDLARNRLIMDAHPDGLGRFAPYTQYAGLFSVSLADDRTISILPNEPSCFCAAAFSVDQFVRLAITEDFTGFDVRVTPLGSTATQTIPAYTVENFTQAGDILIAPDGRQAIYALSQIENFGALDQAVNTIFVLVDLVALTQRPLGEIITTYVHPQRWSDDNTTILFTSPQRAGTWKINIDDGALTRVAELSYLGTLSD